MGKKKKKKRKLIPMEALGEAAECLRMLAHPARLRITEMLLRDRYTVGELARACDIKSHMASEHLRLMQHCGLLTKQREGRKIYYEIAEAHLGDIMGCIRSRFGA